MDLSIIHEKENEEAHNTEQTHKQHGNTQRMRCTKKENRTTIQMIRISRTRKDKKAMLKHKKHKRYTEKIKETQTRMKHTHNKT